MPVAPAPSSTNNNKTTEDRSPLLSFFLMLDKNEPYPRSSPDLVMNKYSRLYFVMPPPTLTTVEVDGGV